jgi:hypothetical protein
MPATLLEIGPDAGDLPIPALGPGETWQSATLHVRAEPTATLTPTLTTSGAASSWISASWSAMRPLTALAITWATPPPPGSFVAIKVAAAGVWFTPVPPGRVHPKTHQPIFSCPATHAPSFPPVLASALLLELRAADPRTSDSGEPDPVTGAIAQLTLTVQNPVIDLRVALGDAAPLAQHRGHLDRPLTLDLAEALRAAPPGSPLRLRAAAAATVSVQWEPTRVLRPQAPPPEPARAVALGDTVRWTQPLANQQIVATSGRIARTLAPERCLLAPADPPDFTLAQAVFPGIDAAQALGTLPEPPHHLDLWVLATRDCAGALQLVREHDARPTDKPVAQQPWTLSAGQARWLSIAVPPRTSGPLWLVCRADHGEALIARALLPGEPQAALQRRLGGAWASVDDPEGRPHLHLRARAPALTPPPVPVQFRRGDRQVTLASDGDLTLGPEQLARLNQTTGPLTLELTAPGTGTVTLAAWDVRLA